MAEYCPQKQFIMKGWLLKWTNYLKGYQSRWFVLSNGTLSYYRNQAEMAHTCRGTINLLGALIHTYDVCSFVISSGPSQAFYLKASGEVERQRWVTALELAKTIAINTAELLDEADLALDKGPQSEVISIIQTLGNKIESLQNSQSRITMHGNDLKQVLLKAEQMETPEEVFNEIKNINQLATLFRITSNAMIINCREFLDLVKLKFHILFHILGDEKNKRKQLQEIVAQFVVQHSILEKATKEKCLPSDNDINRATSPFEVETSTLPSEEDSLQYFDALEFFSTSSLNSSERRYGNYPTFKRRSEMVSVNHKLKVETPLEKIIIHELNMPSTSKSESDKQTKLIPSNTDLKKPCKQRRTRIPDRPNVSMNLWSVLKNCIGKDLSKIPMPVNFSEPLSMLQRLAEDFEYSNVLDHAASCEDVCEQLAYLAAFTISSYSTTVFRFAKPFNPLLGETYELDRIDDYGWKLISEQVSHHPPMAAQHCESKEWTFWQEYTMSSRFRGKYIQVIPLGIAHVLIHKSSNHYTWRKVNTTVHNIIVGSIWVDQEGEMDIVNHNDGSRCHLTFIPFSYFKTENQRRVKGIICDKDGEVKWILNGTWDKEIKIARVLNKKGTKDNPTYETGEYITAWRSANLPPGSEKYYSMSVFACQLNETEEGVAPTDSRFRPDQRLMEEGKFDEANIIKVALEEKQRATRKARERSSQLIQIETARKKSLKKKTGETGSDCESIDWEESDPLTKLYEPTWFKKEIDPITGNIIHVYNKSYWNAKEKQDWSSCPNIFL